MTLADYFTLSSRRRLDKGMKSANVIMEKIRAYVITDIDGKMNPTCNLFVIPP